MLNLPNMLTLSRLPFLFGIVVCLLFAPFPGAATLALFLFLLASLTDWLDGWIARQQDLVSNFGKLMDALTDKVLMVGLFMTFFIVTPRLLPDWAFLLLLLILCREFMVTGLRLLAAARGIILAAEKGGKQKMVTQVVAAFSLLIHHSLQTDFASMLSQNWLDGIGWFTIAAFVAAAFLTISSGTSYLHKYWHILKDADDPTPSR